jgi:hypothetical protein
MLQTPSILATEGGDYRQDVGGDDLSSPTATASELRRLLRLRAVGIVEPLS